MKTIKVILFAIALLIGVNASAQDNPFAFGVKGGLNMSNLSGDVEESKAKIGFNVGVTLDYALTANQDLYLLTGLEYTTKGCGFKKIDGVKPSINLGYLQLPIHLGYKMEVTEATKLVFHAGPYIAYGINGKIKGEEDGDEISTDAFKDDRFKKFDFGLGLGVGAEFGKIGVGLGYDFGLTKINDWDDDSVKNGNAYLTVGYKF